MLINNVDTPAPNFTHLLLAFDLKSIYESDLEHSVVTCLHAIVNYLNSSSFSIQNPILAEYCSELIYKLSSDKYTGVPTLAFLHNQRSYDQNFFVGQLKLLEPEKPDFEDPYVLSHIYQQVWLLKVIKKHNFFSLRFNFFLNRQLLSIFMQLDLLITNMNC